MTFFYHLLFTEIASNLVSGSVNWHNCRIWGSQLPHEFIELQRGSPKPQGECLFFIHRSTTLVHNQVMGPFIFV